MFHTLCSGQKRKNSPNAIAITMSTSVDARRHQPAASTATDDQEPHPRRPRHQGVVLVGAETEEMDRERRDLLVPHALCVRRVDDERHRPHRRHERADDADQRRGFPRRERLAREPDREPADGSKRGDHDVAEHRRREQHRRHPEPFAGLERAGERREEEQPERDAEHVGELAGERAREVAAVDRPRVLALARTRRSASRRRTSTSRSRTAARTATGTCSARPN